MASKPVVISEVADERDVLADLIRGVSQRLSSAAWSAKNHCEGITKVDNDPLDSIVFARSALDEAERHATSLKKLKARLAKVVEA